MRFAYNQEVKSDPRSDIIAEGTPYNRMTSRVMTFVNSPSIISEWQGMYVVTHFGEFVDNHKDCIVRTLICNTFW